MLFSLFRFDFFVFIGSIHQPELGEDDADMMYMNKGALLVWLRALSVTSVVSVECLVGSLVRRRQLLNFQKSDDIQ